MHPAWNELGLFSSVGVLGILYFLSGLDDLFIDLWAWSHGLGPRALSSQELELMHGKTQRRLAIMVAAWNESDVLEKMIRGNVAQLDYGNYHFFIGVYPNDPDTEAIAARLSAESQNIHCVVNRWKGPTSKGQMINEIARYALDYEKGSGLRFDGFLMHDSEDLIHPLSLKLFNALLDGYDFIQIPVFALPLGHHELVAGTYNDEFAENHTKDILVREALGASVPSAGTGTMLSRRLVQAYVLEQGGDLLNPRSLTEDYELGIRAVERGFSAKFACTTVLGQDGRQEYIATRAYFPRRFRNAIRQKTRWTIGIAFQGFENIGWSSSWIQNYFLYRDRKAPITSVLFLFSLCVAIQQLGPERGAFSASVRLFIEANLFFMANRILQRMICTFRVYGPIVALFSLARIPVMNFINSFAAAAAEWRYAVHRVRGRPLAWDKTAHELPSSFGAQSPVIEKRAS